MSQAIDAAAGATYTQSTINDLQDSGVQLSDAAQSESWVTPDTVDVQPVPSATGSTSTGLQTVASAVKAVGSGVKAGAGIVNDVVSAAGAINGTGGTGGTASTGAAAAASVNPSDIAAQQERMFVLQCQVSAITSQYTTLSNCQASADRCIGGIAGNIKG